MPVLPVVGLAVTGVSTETLRLFATVSRVAIVVVLVAATIGTAWLGWLVSSAQQDGRRADALGGASS